MTILQLKYVVALSQSSSMREASSKLYVSQPALSSTIKDLEDDIGIKIFERTNKGITLTPEGNEFIGLAKQALKQYELIENKYLDNENAKDYHSVSTQNYIFATQAFARTVEKLGHDRFSYLIKETRTDEVLLNVRDYKSEIGVLAYSQTNKAIVEKLL